MDGALPLLAICLGIILGALYVSHYTLTVIRRKFVQAGKVAPEDRLPPMIVGACLLAVGLFWFAWTSSPALDPWPQIAAGVPIGFGVQVVLLQSLAYLIDIYTVNSNSAISGTVVVRSLIGGLFPLFAIPMYQRLGVSFRVAHGRRYCCFPTNCPFFANEYVQVFWASNLLGFCALALLPIPILFYFYGARIRSYSKYVPQA